MDADPDSEVSVSEGPHERFIAGQTRKLEAQRALADAKVAAFHARDPITTAQKLAKADAKRARKNAKRLYAPECCICTLVREMTGKERTEQVCAYHGRYGRSRR